MTAIEYRKVALLNIGQSQATVDVDFEQLGVKIIDISPLDAYEIEELLHKFAPMDGELPISSCTAAGDRILISRSALIPELNTAIRLAEAEKVDKIVVTCTGEFELVSEKAELLLPGNILHRKVLSDRWTKDDKIAVLVPVDEQQSFLKKRWRERFEIPVHIEAFTVSPLATMKEFVDIGSHLVKHNYRAAIMDCFGYSIAQGRAVQGAGLAVYLAKGATIESIIGHEKL